MATEALSVPRPTPLAVALNAIPQSLCDLLQWVLWAYAPLYKEAADGQRYIHKWTKIPKQPNGSNAKSDDPSTWSSYSEVAEAYLFGSGFDGIGIVLTNGLQGIDLDDAIDADGTISAEGQELLDKVEGYAEISPSGKGFKLFTHFDSDRFVDHDKGIEVYPGAIYFTVTGNALNGHSALPSEIQDISWFTEKHFGASASAKPDLSSFSSFASFAPVVEGWDEAAIRSELLPKFKAMGFINDPVEDWLRTGKALHHQFNGGPEGLQLWLDIYEDSPWHSKNVTTAPRRYQQFGKNKNQRPITLGSLLKKLGASSARPNVVNTRPVVLQAGTPQVSADEYITRQQTSNAGRLLHRMGGEWYGYTGVVHEKLSEEFVRSEVYEFARNAVTLTAQGTQRPFNPNITKISQIIDALKAAVLIKDCEMPIWLDNRSSPAPDGVISLENGLFDLPRATLMRHTPAFFSSNTLPFSYDPAADCLEWEAFLSSLWGTDQESINCLQEVMGYLLTSDTSFQKMFAIIGPKRSGKSTIGRVITALLGQSNIASPPLSSLVQNFGLAPLIGKMLALIPDARAPGAGQQTIVERLLSITGEDSLTIDRKNKDPVTLTLRSRILLLSNEELQLGDASGALTSRMILLVTTKSFYGMEDVSLESKLLAELPGIFNWCLTGRARLYQRGYFVEPVSSKHMKTEIDGLNSPINLFLDEVTEPGLPTDYVTKKDLYELYRIWCAEQGLKVQPQPVFGKMLRAARPEIIDDRVQESNSRQHVYKAIKLVPARASQAISPFSEH
jgi:putative DNA primase/helicase